VSDTAKTVYENQFNGVEGVEMGDHYFEFGGMGDGYCYRHQTFKCLDNLTPSEWQALAARTYPEATP
jgi:hypothetical protein